MNSAIKILTAGISEETITERAEKLANEAILEGGCHFERYVKYDSMPIGERAKEMLALWSELACWIEQETDEEIDSMAAKNVRVADMEACLSDIYRSTQFMESLWFSDADILRLRAEYELWRERKIVGI